MTRRSSQVTARPARPAVPRRSPREESSVPATGDRRQAILEAAIKEFSAKGLSGARVDGAGSSDKYEVPGPPSLRISALRRRPVFGMNDMSAHDGCSQLKAAGSMLARPCSVQFDLSSRAKRGI